MKIVLFLSPKFVLKDANEDKSALVHIMVWGLAEHNWTNVDNYIQHHIASVGDNSMGPLSLKEIKQNQHQD